MERFAINSHATFLNYCHETLSNMVYCMRKDRRIAEWEVNERLIFSRALVGGCYSIVGRSAHSSALWSAFFRLRPHQQHHFNCKIIKRRANSTFYNNRLFIEIYELEQLSDSRRFVVCAN